MDSELIADGIHNRLIPCSDSLDECFKSVEHAIEMRDRYHPSSSPEFCIGMALKLLSYLHSNSFQSVLKSYLMVPLMAVQLVSLSHTAAGRTS